MRNIKTIIMAAALAAGVSGSFAQQVSPMDHGAHQASGAVQSAGVAEMTDGEVRKVDKSTGKITLKHGAIKNLDMPPMTMVFGVKEASMLDEVKAGDKVRFAATSQEGRFTVTEIQAAK